MLKEDITRYHEIWWKFIYFAIICENLLGLKTGLKTGFPVFWNGNSPCTLSGKTIKEK